MMVWLTTTETGGSAAWTEAICPKRMIPPKRLITHDQVAPDILFSAVRVSKNALIALLGHSNDGNSCKQRAASVDNKRIVVTIARIASLQDCRQLLDKPIADKDQSSDIRSGDI
jgi:hypothetical protein